MQIFILKNCEIIETNGKAVREQSLQGHESIEL